MIVRVVRPSYFCGLPLPRTTHEIDVDSPRAREELELWRDPGMRESAAPLSEVIETVWNRGGKRLRPLLVYTFGELCGCAPERLGVYAWAAEAVHTASLLHDDVIDESQKRRGGPSANALYDNTLPILSGDLLLSEVVGRMTREGSAELLKGLCETLRRLCLGESLQYRLRFTIPSDPAVYERIAELKTASLFEWSALIAPTLTRHSLFQAVETYARSLGVLFQGSDDLLDVVGTSTKRSGQDLREGSLNRVTWALVQQDPVLKRRIEEAFQRRGVGPAEIDAMGRSPKLGVVVGQFRQELTRLAREASEVLSTAVPGDARDLLQQLPQWVVDRCL